MMINRRSVSMSTLIFASLSLSIVVCVTTGTSPAAGKPLAGHIEVESAEDDPLPEFKVQQGVLDSGIRGGIEENKAPPTWIQGKVFSNNDMYMYSFWRFMGFKREWRWNLPTSRKTTLFFKQDIARHWKGEFKPTDGCSVTCVPIEGGERFRFFHKNPLGPHGYLERVGETKSGYPRYRIWFTED